MSRNHVITNRFSTKKSTDTGYLIVRRWDIAFKEWFKSGRQDCCWDRIAILTDEHVWALYGHKIHAVVEALGRPLVPLILPPGEKSKDFKVLPGLVKVLLQNRVHRRDLLVCAGGGLCCDMGGLLAMLYMRGMDYVNLPTSLMAQIDAAVGGKVGSNLGIYKNLLGGFHQPLQVFIDASFLNTLPDIHFKSALAEAVKIAIIREEDDKVLMALLEKQPEKLLNRQQKQLSILLKCCLQGKLELLAADPYETCLDRSLNLGHAVAHALERLPVLPGPRKPLHGEAVAIGLAATIRYAFKCGLCSSQRALRLLGILKGLTLPLQTASVNPRQLKSNLARISQQRGGLMRLVVPVDKGVYILPNPQLDTLIQCLQPIAEPHG
jgi:3-dehydroquinate synthase